MNHPLEKIAFEKIQSIVEQTIGNLSDFCFLLGSAATPRFRQDIDITVYWKYGEIDFDLKLEIMNELEDKLGHDRLARERRNKLQEGSNYWNFDCKHGKNKDSAIEIHVSEINKGIDRVVSEQAKKFYIEILAKPGFRKKKPV